MFRSWLRITDRCDACELDYDFASPDDGPAFFSLCFVAFPLLFIVVWLEVALNPPWWVHVLVSAPLMIVPCLLVLRPIKGWLVASQYVNKAKEAGTDALWDKLNARAKREAKAVGGGTVADVSGRRVDDGGSGDNSVSDGGGGLFGGDADGGADGGA